MSGKVNELGYRGQSGHRASRCGGKDGNGCGQRIQWGQLFGKRHPFNLDGTSHFDTCPNADNFRRGLRTLGDLDTYYRERWRAENYTDTREFDRSGLRLEKVPVPLAVGLAKSLCGVGGPLHTAGWPVGYVQECFLAAGLDDKGEVVAVSCDNLILFRLRDYFYESDFRPYMVNGVFLVGRG